ncbi:MAG: hypothetical protein WA714_23405 [Candidatus Acidiferrales bacterium]
MIGLQRAGRLKAEYITREIHPSVNGLGLENLSDPSVVEAELAATVTALSAMNLVSGFQSYASVIKNKLYRAINQLERLQRTRKREFVPATESIDVSAHSQPEGEA